VHRLSADLDFLVLSLLAVQNLTTCRSYTFVALQSVDLAVARGLSSDSRQATRRIDLLIGSPESPREPWILLRCDAMRSAGQTDMDMDMELGTIGDGWDACGVEGGTTPPYCTQAM
jgi:hypothetical protein